VSSRRASGADSAAISALYERQFRAFVAGAYAVIGESEAARDVVQEAFARALRERRGFRGDGSLEAWLWRVTPKQGGQASDQASKRAPGRHRPLLARTHHSIAAAEAMRGGEAGIADLSAAAEALGVQARAENR
jgi:DNA-directed RNA polymerase specialized sigma24 family protein